MKQRFRNLPIDVWFEPLVFIVLAVGYFSWYATTTFTETEQASLGWSTLQSTIIDHIDRTIFDDDRLFRLADAGVVLEWDLFGQESC